MSSESLDGLSARLGADYEHLATTPKPSKTRALAEPHRPDANCCEHPRQGLFVVIVYNDRHAASRAAEALERLKRNSRAETPQRLLPVPIAQLDEPSRFDRLLFDANSADMIIVSYNSASDFSLILKKWIGNCLAQKRRDESAVLALLSSNEQVDAPDSPRYQFLKNPPWNAGADCFAPKPDVKCE